MTAPNVVPLTPVTKAVLLLFLQDPDKPLSMGDLTSQLGVSTTATRATLGRLMEVGWVAHSDDRPPLLDARRAGKHYYRLTAVGADRARTAMHAGGPGDLVATLVDLRNAITPLVEDLLCGVRVPVERWLSFAEVISNVIPLCRRQALSEPPSHP